MSPAKALQQAINRDTLLPLGLVVALVSLVAAGAYALGTNKTGMEAQLDSHETKLVEHDQRIKANEKAVADLKSPLSNINDKLDRLLNER